MTNRYSMNGHLERSVESDRLRRAVAARLDPGFKRAAISSARAARWLDVSEYDVHYWGGMESPCRR